MVKLISHIDKGRRIDWTLSVFLEIVAVLAIVVLGISWLVAQIIVDSIVGL